MQKFQFFGNSVIYMWQGQPHSVKWYSLIRASQGIHVNNVRETRERMAHFSWKSGKMVEFETKSGRSRLISPWRSGKKMKKIPSTLPKPHVPPASFPARQKHFILYPNIYDKNLNIPIFPVINLKIKKLKTSESLVLRWTFWRKWKVSIFISGK